MSARGISIAFPRTQPSTGLTNPMTSDLDMSLYQILNFRIENVAELPSAGDPGRVVYLTTDEHLYLDRG